MTFKELLALDAKYSKELRVAEKQGKLRSAAAFFAHSGDSWFWALGLLLIWIFGVPLWKQWAAVQFGGIMIMAIIVLIVKFSVKRKRPEGEWGLMYRSTDPHSFPSGHSARSFLIGMMAIFLTPHWLGFILIIWAILVALGRVAMGVHYLSDIFVGALLGILGGWVGFKIYPYIYAWFVNWSGLTLW